MFLCYIAIRIAYYTAVVLMSTLNVKIFQSFFDDERVKIAGCAKCSQPQARFMLLDRLTATATAQTSLSLLPRSSYVQFIAISLWKYTQLLLTTLCAVLNSERAGMPSDLDR